MKTNLTRRELLKRGGAYGLLVSGFAWTGCGSDDEQDPPVNETVTLKYEPSDKFIEGFKAEREAGKIIQVEFDGTNKLDKDSPLLELLTAQEDDSEILMRALQEKDTESGRQELAQIFAPDLLEHEEISVPMECPSGEIIEPGTVMLVIVVFCLLAGTTAVANEIHQDGRIKSVEVGPGPYIRFEFWQVNA